MAPQPSSHSHESGVGFTRFLLIPISSTLVGPHRECWVRLWVPQYKRCGHTEESPVEGHENGNGAGEHFLWGEAEKGGAVQPGEGSEESLITAYKYLKGRNKKDRAMHLPVEPSVPSSNGHSLEHRSFSLNTRQYFCAVRVHWYRLPKGCGISSLENFISLAPCSGWPTWTNFCCFCCILKQNANLVRMNCVHT